MTLRDQLKASREFDEEESREYADNLEWGDPPEAYSHHLAGRYHEHDKDQALFDLLCDVACAAEVLTQEYKVLLTNIEGISAEHKFACATMRTGVTRSDVALKALRDQLARGGE